MPKALKTGLKAPKLGRRPSLGVFGPYTDQDYAGCRPALIEFFKFWKIFSISFNMIGKNNNAGQRKLVR